MITFAKNPAIGDISSIGGEEGSVYTAWISVGDIIGGVPISPAIAWDWGKITHYASVKPYKSAPPVVGAGHPLTYSIHVINHGFSTDLPPILTDVVPLSTTFVWASDGGISMAISNTVVVSWTLPDMNPGDRTVRQFRVLVDNDLVSGTQIVNELYSSYGYGNVVTDAVTHGPPVTTTVQDVGLIHSFKMVTPVVSLPGEGIVLTYYAHIVNSSSLPLTDVVVYDLLPWQTTTYQRDAVASAGEVMSDIVSVWWEGDVGPLSTEIVTLSVVVDPDVQGAVTNTAVISHPYLQEEVVVDAVAYITDKPVLRIIKSASPDPVERGEEYLLVYTIRVTNLGQEATSLVITDALPLNVNYIAGSANRNGELVEGVMNWSSVIPLAPGETREYRFSVWVESGTQVVNDRYGVRCFEGVSAFGDPVITQVAGGGPVYLPLVLRLY
jgi:uncharacterized repeat protein (TIGR01451 family)